MPINYETPGGYYDGSGQFHQNTYLMPTPIPGISTTGPINPALPYNPFPDVQPYIPGNLKFPSLPNLPNPTFPLNINIPPEALLLGAAVLLFGRN